MKRLLPVFLVILFSWSVSSAQTCVSDDYDWGTASFGVSPDPTQGETFEIANVGVPYHDVIYVKCPAMAGDILSEDHPLYAMAQSVALDSVKLRSITLLEGTTEIQLSSIGLALACNNNNESNDPCMFFPSNNYCGDITGTPTVTGTWPVRINITAYFNLFGAQAIDYPMEGYTFVVQGTAAVLETPKESGFTVMQNIPNPAINSTSIPYFLTSPEPVSIVVTNLIGERIISKTVKGKKGENVYNLNTSEIPNGIYLYSVQTDDKKVTKRMVVQH